MKDSPFKTTWAGKDAEIHAKKPTWSVGNLSIPGSSNISPPSHKNEPFVEPFVEPIKEPEIKSNTMNQTTQVHMWVLSGLLSWLLTSMNNKFRK